MTEKSAKKNSLSDLKLYGAPWYITVIGCIVVIAAAMAFGALGGLIFGIDPTTGYPEICASCHGRRKRCRSCADV